jgi:general secretion pathway protein I
MRRGEAGFTLFETIVALAVFVGAIAMLYEAMGGNWRGLRRVQRDVVALSLAKSTIAAAGVETPLIAGQRFSGNDDGIGWELRVEAYEPTGDQTSGAAAPKAYWLIFQAGWTDGPGRRRRTLELRNLKFGDQP